VDSGIGDADLADADSLVSGALALPCELEELAQAAPESVSAEVHGSPYGDVLRSRQRDGFAIGAVMVTWDVVVFVACATDSGQRSFIPVSQRYLATFMRLLGIGALDEVLRDCLRTRFRRRTLRSIDQIHTVAAFNRLGSRDGLLTREIASQ
jgi:hypothetical protein